MDRIAAFILGLFTAFVGHAIHGSIFWAIMDFFFWPFAWIKWFIYQEVTIAIIKNAFSFLN